MRDRLDCVIWRMIREDADSWTWREGTNHRFFDHSSGIGLIYSSSEKWTVPFGTFDAAKVNPGAPFAYIRIGKLLSLYLSGMRWQAMRKATPTTTERKE